MRMKGVIALAAAAALAAGCSRVEDAPAHAAETPALPLPDEFAGAEKLFASGDMEGFEKFPTSLILDRSQAIDLLERAYAGTNGVSGFVMLDGVSYSAEPRLAFTYKGKSFLVVAHEEHNAPHVSAGGMSYFIFESDSGPPSYRLPFMLFTGSWGAEPNIQPVRLSNDEPAAIVSGGGTFQGCTYGGGQIIRFTDTGIVASPYFPLYNSTEAFVNPPIEIELAGVQLSEDGTSMALRYLGQRNEENATTPLHENRTLAMSGENPWMEQWPYWC